MIHSNAYAAPNFLHYFKPMPNKALETALRPLHATTEGVQLNRYQSDRRAYLGRIAMTHNKKEGFLALAPAFFSFSACIAIFSSIAVAASPTPKQLEDALTEVKSEPKVISAAWNDTSIPSLLVGVADDKTQRDGYAQYICLVLAEHGIKGGVVRIMDEYAARRNEWKELGKSWCPE